MKNETAIDGIIKCIKNAENLIEAAQLLFSKNYRVGTALIVTAIEEYGKAVLVMGYHAGVFPEKKFRREFRSHLHKRAIGFISALIGTAVADGTKEAIKFRRILLKLDFDAVRDSALYVSYQDANFLAPPNEDIPNFVMALRLALRLKRIFHALTDESSCAEVLKEPWDPSEKLTGRGLAIDKLLRNLKN